MTTAYKATRGKAGFPKAGAGDACNVKVAAGTFEIVTPLIANDTIDFCRLPAGAVVLGGWLYGDDIDSGSGVFDFDIGWTANGNEAAQTAGLGNNGALNGTAVTNVNPEGGIKLPLGGKLLTDGPQKFTAETLIQGVCNVAANAGGTGTLNVIVYYFMDPNFSLT